MGSAVTGKEQDFTLHACFGVIRFLSSLISSCGLRLDLLFSAVGAFVAFTGLVQLWALQRSTVYTCSSDWRPAGTEAAGYLLLVCLLSLALRCTQLPDCEVKSMVSYAGLCQSQIVVAKAQSLEHVASWVEQCLPWVHIVCSTWHGSARLREAARWPSESVTLSCVRRKTT